MEKVLEKLRTTESTTSAVSRETDGKIRLTSQLWPEPKVMILKGEVLEVHGRLQSLARSTTRMNGTAGRACDPCGPGIAATDKVIKA